MSDSTLDLSFGRTRGGGGRFWKDESCMFGCTDCRRGRACPAMLLLRRELTAAMFAALLWPKGGHGDGLSLGRGQGLVRTIRVLSTLKFLL